MVSIEDRPISSGLASRVRGVLAHPRAEWDRIALEPTSQTTLMTGYACILAAIGPVAQLVGSQVFGIHALWTRYYPSLSGAIAEAVMDYVMALVAVYVLALVVQALAPAFGGEKSRIQALKVTVYSATPGWLAGVFLLIPNLLLLVFLASLYGVYLLYLGLPRVMKAPRPKALTYMAVTVLSACLIYLVCTAVTSAVVDVVGGPGRFAI
jgi:hypothetical protein